MIVRKAETIEDVDRMVELGARMHSESGYRTRPYIPAKLRSYGIQFLHNPSAGVLILAEDNFKVCGMMAGWALRSFFNEDICVRDMILYMLPEKRKGTTALRMVRQFEDWAKCVGAREINVGITANIDDAKATKFYNTMGYRQRGLSLFKEV
jgi:hypothetical protein